MELASCQSKLTLILQLDVDRYLEQRCQPLAGRHSPILNTSRSISRDLWRNGATSSAVHRSMSRCIPPVVQPGGSPRQGWSENQRLCDKFL